MLQREDFLLHRAACDQLVARHHARLADAMRAIRRLVFHRRIPPRIEMDDRVGSRQVQADTTRFQTDEKHRNGSVRLKPIDHRGPVGG